MSVSQNSSLLVELGRLNQNLLELPCPSCGKRDPSFIWRRDRYFLEVNLSACRGCGVVYLARGLSGEAQTRFYSHIYPRLMRQPPPEDALCHYRLIAGYRYSEINAVVGECSSVLDVGSGLGFFLDACRAHGCEQYAGIEPGGPQREHAVHTLGLGEAIQDGYLDQTTQLPFKPKLVTLFHVLEHLDEPGKALGWIAKLIAPDGWLVIEVPDILANWPKLGLWQIHISHRSYFCMETLEALLQKNGFKVQHSCREAYGIYEGNLRVYARLSEQCVSEHSVAQHALISTKAHIKKQIRPWSLRNGYPRAAVRLLRLALKRH
ncbi:class I SAM-dependent methyltransferase [Pseudomonas sp. SL4(2022)]|uniref:class I SAM-dependent methyltransferase n=1 Tax=Pseudomonas sp. SL4(2022) TaxID=2994661 RepID=UPI00226D4B93|nr:class I SAM-dependent methyltransferase [Pseudomonas sp. SL4(2022)]WAC45994.1 class I SAM-dependent methyltransferase [Pseudomonas sp. SL4(2022)]